MKYEYAAVLDRVIDGDTIDMIVDLGFGIYRRDRFRLAGIDTAELNSPDVVKRDMAKAAKALVISWFQDRGSLEGREFTIRTHKDEREKYGRYLAEVWSDEPGKNDPSLNEALLLAGLAVPYDGGKR